MRISKLEIFQIALPLKEPFIISYHTYHEMPAVIVKIHTDQGIVGYGEAVPDEHVTGETIHSVVANLKYKIAPTLLGQDPRNIKKVHQLMNEQIVKNGATKAAIDIACYDILGKVSGLPIYSLLGGRKDENPKIPRVLSILEPEVLAVQAKEAVAEGYAEIKMKLGIDAIKDIARVKAVREAVGDSIPIRVDVNQGWKTPQQAIQIIRKLEPYGVSWVEQPILQNSISFFKRLKEVTQTPLMADESLINEQHLRSLALDSSVDFINIKLMKSGGIYPAYQLATQAELFGIECQIGSMVESSIASAAGFHVALSRDNIISTEISGPTKFHIDTGNLTYRLPEVILSDQPGLGIDVDDAVIDEICTYRTTVEQ